MIWLALFFLAPLVIILVVSLGSGDATGHIVLDNPNLDNYFQALAAGVPAGVPRTPCGTRWSPPCCRSLIGYPIAYWISRHGGRHKILLLILVMLPFWTS